MSKLLLFSLFIFIGFSSLGQKYSFVTYSTEQGLPQSQVTSITQDSKGYIWIGTLGGLAKFNGQKFVTYSADDGLLNYRVTALESFDNTVWVGHDGGISMIKNNEVTSIEFSGTGNDRSRNVSKIIKFKDKVLICSRGGLFEKKGSTLTKIELPTADFEMIRSAFVYQNKLYLATRGGIIVSNDAISFKLMSEFGEISCSGVTGQGDKLVVSSYNDGVFIKNMKSGNTTMFSAKELKHSIDGCYFDQDGNVWMSTKKGVIRITPKSDLVFYDDSNGLPVNRISYIFNDDVGNVWIGSQGKGIFKFPSDDFRYYDQTTGLPSDLYVSGFQDSNGDYYFGTYDEGLVKQTSAGEVSRIDINESTIWVALENVDNKHWFGTGHSLVSIDRSSSQIEEYTSSDNDQIPGFKITGLYKVADNAMYVGGNYGVSFYKDGVFTKLGPEDTEIGTVRDFELKDGVLYCVSNLGMFKYAGDRFESVPGTEMVIYSLEMDQHGVLWYGSEEGLFKYEDEKVERIQISPDPASNFIAFMNFRNGELYLGTNNGLFILSSLSQKQPTGIRFGTGDGVIDLESNLNSGFFDRNGDFWFGTASGLVCYHKISEKEAHPSVKPRISMASILLNYESFDYSLYSEKLTVDGLPLALSLPSSKNNLIFKFDGVSLVYEKGLTYQFMLEGLREEWSQPSEDPSIFFTNLPAGEYILHVRSIDISGIYSEEFNFPFVIKPAFYKTWWFILLSVVIIALTVALIFRLRIRRLAEVNERERLEYTSRLLSLEQKSMNASMNRHFIFNSLNSIQYFINTQDRLSANKYLTNFAQLIRKNLDSATAEGNMVSLGEELERLELYLSLESMRFKDRFEYKIDTGGIDVESVLIPPMMMQPFIENSIIHGILPNEKKGEIRIIIEKDQSDLIIRIEDNGIGINQSLSQKTDMQGDHRSQGMEITSKRIELLRKVSDNEISLIGPNEIIDNNRSVNGTRVLIKIPLENLDI